MSSSDDSDNPFGNESSEDKEEERENALTEAPEYTRTSEFLVFQRNQLINFNQKYGYVYIHTYKPFYFPGEIIRGCIILDLFNDLPKANKKVMLRFKGGEEVGRHYEKCKKEIEKQKRLENLNASSNSNNDKLV